MNNDRSTWLTRLCEHIIEACWLAALIVAPLFFNVYSHRIFEPDKTAVLRSIGLIMALAWIIRGLEQWAANRTNRVHEPRPGARSAWGTVFRLSIMAPVLPLALLLLIDYAVATAVSVAPRFSFWGSYARMQGLYTMAVYIGSFLSITALLHTREQLERIITAALVVSLPVSLYGIIQYFGTDPLLWASDVTLRVASSMGNPLFVAAFLILTVPLTLYRLFVSGGAAAKGESAGTKRVLLIGGLLSMAFQMASWQAGPVAGTASALITVGTWIALALLLGKSLVPFLRISIYTVVLSAQLMCILFSQSRGPWLALVVGLFLFALLWTLVQHRRKQASIVVGSGLTVALLLVLMNLPASPLGFVREVPYAGRLGQLFDTDVGSARVRVLIWEGVEDVLADNPIRSLIGYGPETLHLVYPPHYPPELGRVGERAALPDRAHNETFDTLVRTGLVGGVIYLLLFTSLFYYGLRWIGLLRTRGRRSVFLGLWFGGGVVALLLFRLIDGSWRFGGVALPVGMVAGLFVYLCYYGLFMMAREHANRADRPQRLIVVTLLAVLMAHFVEIQLGLAIAATRTYFWSCAALLVVCGIFYRQRPDLLKIVTAEPQSRLQLTGMPRAHRPASGTRAIWRRPLIAASLIVGLVLVTLVYDFLVPIGGLDETLSVLWLLAFTWGFAGFIVITETWAADHSMRDVRQWLGASAVYATISVFVMLIYAILQGSILRMGVDPGNVPVSYFAAVPLIVIALGFALLRNESLPARTWARWLSPGYLILTIGMLLVSYTTNLNAVRADIHFKRAAQMERQGRNDEAVSLFRRALALMPEQDVYYLFLGRALLQEAAASSEPETLLQEAERVLTKARSLSPLNSDHTANLARLYQNWARRTEGRPLRAERFRRSLSLFEHATALSPNTADLWNDRGTTHLMAGDTAAALQAYERSLALDDTFYKTHLLMGNLYFAQRRWRDAASAYEKVLEQERGLLHVRIALGFAKAKMIE